MRPVTKAGLAPLAEADQKKMFEEDIPYRLSLLRDGCRPAWIHPCQHTNQAFEAGVVSGRILLSFLGLACDRTTGALRTDRKHDAKVDQTDDVKAPDVGGQFVELEDLTQNEKDALAVFIRGAHKACAHFTIGSDHHLNLQTYADAGPIIFRIMAENFPTHAESWPKWSN
jgi:hypothetical protein